MVKTVENIFAPYNPKYHSTKNEWSMQCPFRENHSSSGPGAGLKSFFVNTEKNYYNCFSCKVSGPLIGLLVTKFNVPFMEAHELVNTTNIDYLFKEKQRPDEFELDEVLSMKPPRAFLERGFSAELLKRFMVGEGTVNYNGKEIRNVITIPIFDNDGLAIRGIKYRKDRVFWYSANFVKEDYLYNVHNCKNSWFCLVEGETDVYGSVQNGIIDVCATLGGVLSVNQVSVLRDKGFNEARLAFDRDVAGLKNIEIANFLLSPYMRVNVVTYNADDPGSCEKEEWQDAVNESYVDYSAYSLRMVIENGDEYLKLKKECLKKLSR